ncbi:uncharacterized protein RAG0_06176 [Rhynchosporium agropyri]|uniref:Uncharacterized protein n=1 Tax=Rhynchosporium agropyri TaxID=914238 RepID=A0A1E1KGA3_9HELO|nr:uncharacterized protein RAG0_06176 [Rhynchosporium agropyri]
MSHSHWYNFGRDTSDTSEPAHNAHKARSSPTPLATAGPSQGRASADEDDEPPPPLIKGRTWLKKKEARQNLKAQYYKRYELDWPKLRGRLNSKFPGVEFTEELDASRDEFVFYTPRDLDESLKTEREAIGRLRNDYRED